MTRVPGATLPVVAALLLALVPSGSPAQAGWAVDVAAGRATYDPVSSAVGTHNLSLGLRYGEQPQWLYLSGGAPLASGGVHWGAAGLGGRLAVSRKSVSAGLDLGTHLFGYSGRGDTSAESVLSGGGAIVEAVPVLAFEVGAAALEIRSGLLRHTELVSDVSSTRQAHDSGARMTLSRGTFLSLVTEGRYLRVPEGDYPYAGGAVQLARGKLSLWGLVGRWLSQAIPTPALGGGVSLRVGERTEVQAAWEQEPNHPLYWNAPRRAWNVQVSRRLGSTVRAAPAYSRGEDGRVVIRIPLSASPSAPFVVGDFTRWQPVPMARSGRFWAVSLPIVSGTHYYGFRHADGTWFIPSSVPQQVDDGMGGTTAVLLVP